MSVALAATLHDATGALRAETRRRLPALRALYPAGIAVATSPPTAASMRALLDAEGVHAGSPRTNVRGPLYRLALRRALATGAARVHYLDFDRALHWQAAAPGEYAALLRLALGGAPLLIGRSERAHRSHHRPLHETETAANRHMAERLGWRGRIDFLVPSFVLGRGALGALLRASRTRDAAVYGELAALVAATPGLAYVECDGLDWETPDRHPRAVARVGLAAWRARFDQPEERTLRAEMAASIVRGFERTLARVSPFGPAPRACRLRAAHHADRARR